MAGVGARAHLKAISGVDQAHFWDEAKGQGNIGFFPQAIGFLVLFTVLTPVIFSPHPSYNDRWDSR